MLKTFFLWFLFVCFYQSSGVAASAEGAFRLHLPNIGQGNCIFLSNHDKTFIGIFDCGSVSEFIKQRDEKIIPLLEEVSSKKKSKWLIVISHPDQDHYNFLPAIIENIKPKLERNKIELTLVLGGPLEKYLYYQGNYPLKDTIKYLIESTGARIISMSHDMDHGKLLEIINESERLIGQSRVHAADTVEKAKGLFLQPVYQDSMRIFKDQEIQKKIKKAVKKKEQSVKRKLSKQEFDSIEEQVMKEFEDSSGEDYAPNVSISDFFKEKIKHYFRNSELSNPKGNILRGYVQNTNISTFIGSDVIPTAIEIRVLSANAGQSDPRHQVVTVINEDENTNSMILQIVHLATGNSILLPGDATGITTDRILSQLPEQRTKYLIASHHGADTEETNNEEWAYQIKPEFILFSAEGSKYNHPRCSSVANYLPHAMPAPLHDLTCYRKRNEPYIDFPFGTTTRFLDINEDIITLQNVDKAIYYSGDNIYPVELPFP